MTVAELLSQAKTLSPQERKELAKLLIDTLDSSQSSTQAKTGAEIVALLQTMEPIAFVAPHLDDPVEWVKTQRRKRAETLAADWDGKE